MPTTSVSITTSLPNAANATGFMQADGFFSPVVIGSPTNVKNGGHSVGPAYMQSGVRYNVQAALTAHAGGGQGSAVLLIVGINNVTVVGTAADSVILPTFGFNSTNLLPVGASDTIVRNSSATSMAVFPPTGGTINGGSANASINMAAGTFATFALIAANTWIVVA